MFPMMSAAPGLTLLVLVAADSPPNFDVSPSCRAAAQRAVPVGDASVCVRTEQKAREEIVKRWSEFSRSDKATCVPLATTGGNPTYTELLTCLEMSRQARLYNEKERSTTGQATEKDRSTTGQATTDKVRRTTGQDTR
jgi:hypothetical protein